ncbi:MAG TPA: hypothetical protein VH600_20345 [Burkholderiales bacterium]|jgi:hypothetical protein
MSFWFQAKRSLAALFGLAVALIGLALVLQFAALLLWQYGIALQKFSWPRLPIGLLFADHAKLANTALAPYLQYLPQIEWSWLANRADTSATRVATAWVLDKVHIGLVPALLGVPLLLGGSGILVRNLRAASAAGRYKRDRMRRVEQYRNSPLEERREPVDFSAAAPTEVRNERFEHRKEPFIGAEVEKSVNDPELEIAESVNDAEAEVPRRSAVNSHKYY